jgi:nucleoside-diphosphate-sugar epimerase
MNKILITGGAGYIGSILVPDLLSLGYEVTVIDNFLYRENSLANCCINPNFKIINGDVRNNELILSLLKNTDFIIPLAAYVGAPLCSKDPLGATSINKDAIKFIIDNTSVNQKIIMPTTNSGYGIGESGKFCTEDSPLNPVSLYGKDKVEIESYMLQRPNTISLRLATVFGMSPRMRLDLLVNDFTYRACKDKFIVLFQSNYMRNYIHVKDVSAAFIHTIKNFDLMKNQAYNVGLSEANISKLELCNRIKLQIPDFSILESEIGTDPDQRDYIVSNKKIEATGYYPKISLDIGITELIKGFKMLQNSRYSNI